MIQQFHFGYIPNRIESRASKRFLYIHVYMVNTTKNVKCLAQRERANKWMLLLQPSGFPALGFSFPCAGRGSGQSSLHGLCPLRGVTKTRSPLPCSSWECPAIRDESGGGGGGKEFL